MSSLLSSSSSESPKRPLFFYGTLMATKVYEQVMLRHSIPYSIPRSTPAILKGYKRYRVKNAPYPGIIPSDVSNNDGVKGLLAYVQTQQEVDVLDRFEGEEYERRTVSVELADSTIVEADVYVWIAGVDKLILTAEWDFYDFVKNNLEPWVFGGKESRFL